MLAAALSALPNSLCYWDGASGGSTDIDPEPFQASRMAQLLCKASFEGSEANATRLYQSIFLSEDGNLVPQSLTFFILASLIVHIL